MDVIIIVSMIMVIVFGFYLMVLVDDFLDANYIKSLQEMNTSKMVLIFTDHSSKEAFESICEDPRCNCCIIDNSIFPDSEKLSVFFAISSDDSENLFMTKLAKKRNKDLRVVVKANNIIYKDLYRSIGVDRIMSGPVTEDTLTRTILEVTRFE